MPAMSAPWDVAGTIVLTSDEMCGGLPDHLEVAHDSIDRLAINHCLAEDSIAKLRLQRCWRHEVDPMPDDVPKLSLKANGHTYRARS